MEEINKSLNGSCKNWLKIILLLGLILRVFFILFGGKFYFSTANFQIQGDTYGWMDSIMNLINFGTYSSDLTVPNACFFRPPGYSFVIGLFYYIGGTNMQIGLQILSWVQIILDILSIGLFFNISRRIGGSATTSLIAAFLYACYPFIIVWTPVLYAESISVFIMLTSIYFLLEKVESKRKYFISGILLGIAVLIRLQCIFILPGFIIYIFKSSITISNLRRNIMVFILSFGLIYGLWPARNLILHHRFVFSQDLNVGKHWSPDYMSFMNYIFAIKTDHQPQYQQIIENKIVNWPHDAYVTKGDSLLLAKTINECRTCGTGFSYFKYHAGLIKAPLGPGHNCDIEIENNFNQLLISQKKNNSFNYYVKIPLSNLKKALFKFSLYGNKSNTIKLAGAILFSYRTFLIFLGLLAIILNYQKKWFNINFSTLILCYFIIWYLYLSFIYRNMEIRYFLQTDILLLLPAAFIINFVYLEIKKKRSNLKLKNIQ